MAHKTKVRVTIEPGVVRSVDDSELLDLDRQGLVHSSESGEYGSHKWQAEEPEAEEPEAEEPGTIDEAPAASKTSKKGA